jgi:hypothetical protein
MVDPAIVACAPLPVDPAGFNQAALLPYGCTIEHVTKADWKFSGRSETSRRTITASVTESGHRKMIENWVYRAPVQMSDSAN